MSNSILTTVKKAVGGIIEEDESFDTDIIMHINTVLSQLTQLGVGPEDGFQIEDKTATWTDFYNDEKLLNMIQSYVVLSVRQMFDPPSVGAVAEAYNTRIAELGWRIREQAEYMR